MVSTKKKKFTTEFKSTRAIMLKQWYYLLYLGDYSTTFSMPAAHN